MPYVPPEQRDTVDAAHPGTLNYVLTRVAIRYLEARGGLSYDALAEVVSAFECAKLEIYRRVAAPYEDRKIAANGDVYPPEWVQQ